MDLPPLSLRRQILNPFIYRVMVAMREKYLAAGKFNLAFIDAGQKIVVAADVQ